MSEEEKKAIERIKKLIIVEKCNCEIHTKNKKAVETIINLINKQQKEIKKLEEQKRGLLVETYKNNDEKDKEIEELKKCYVIKPKELEKEINKEWQDKIREKIKQFQDLKKYILKIESEIGMASITYDIIRNDYCEGMLKQLLEE